MRASWQAGRLGNFRRAVGSMRRRFAGGPVRWHRTVAVIAGLLSITMLPACRASAIDTLPDKDFIYCTILADAPRPSHDTIVGPSHYRCDGNGADSITLTVMLQELGPGNAWKTVASGEFVAHGRDTSRHRIESTRTHSVSVPCATGKFRTVMHAVEVSKGKSKATDGHSVTVPNPCSRIS